MTTIAPKEDFLIELYKLNQMNLSTLPDNLPIPKDDGLASHLLNTELPEIALNTTSGESVNINAITGCVVLFIYPMTGNPNIPLPDGWDDIPGARGCTPQVCSFKDKFNELQNFKVNVFGVSTQFSDYQKEVKERLELPYELLSDNLLTLKSAMSLPTFKAADMELYKRLTVIAIDGKIVKVFYPVFPPNKNVDEVITWLSDNN